MKKRIKNLLCIMLAASMLFSSVDCTAFAAEQEVVSDSNLTEIIDSTSSEIIEESDDSNATINQNESEQSEDDTKIENVESEAESDTAEDMLIEDAINEDNLLVNNDDSQTKLADTLPIEEVTDEMSGGDPEWFIENGYFSRDDGTIDSEALESNHGYVTGPDKSGGKTIKGIDVSRWQNEKGTIDWNAVRNSGVEFVFIRAAYRTTSSGSVLTDPYARTNIEDALSAGLRVGLYVFSQALSNEEAIEEANCLLGIAKDYNITMPLVFDYEFNNRLKASNAGDSTAKCLAFCQTIENNGYTPCVYANLNTLTKYIDSESISSRYPIWLARYNSYAGNDVDYTYWQYSSSGKVSGINGDVDVNYWYPVKRNIFYDFGAVSKSLVDNSVNPSCYYEGYTHGLKIKAPKYRNATFQGWFTNKNYNKLATTNITYKTRGDLKFYTYWTYRVTLDTTIGVLNNQNKYIDYDYGTEEYGEALAKLEPVNDKNKFAGWYYYDPLNDEEVEVGNKIVYEGNHTLVAHWTPENPLPPINVKTDLSNNNTVKYGTKLVLDNEIDDVQIYYTMTYDGSEPPTPTIESEPYQQPIRLYKDVRIKAFATKNTEYKDSEVLSLSIKVEGQTIEDILGDLSSEEMESLTKEQKDAVDNNYFWCKDIDDQIYTGANITPSVSVYCGNKLLASGTDYRVKYTLNRNVGVATAVVTGRGAYSGTISKSFNIVPKSISDVANEIERTTVAYNKRGYIPSIRLVKDNRQLRANRDYVLSWNGGINDRIINPGITTITVKGINNYSGQGTFEFKVEDIDRVPISKVRIENVVAKEYTGKPVYQDSFVVKYGSEVLKEGTDYTCSYNNNTDISSKAELILTGKEGSRFFGTTIKYFKINGKNIKNVQFVYSNETYTYNGANIEPAGPANNDVDNSNSGIFTLKDTGTGKTLVKGKDYVVSYYNNLNAGNAKIYFTGINEYTGTRAISFRINKYNLSSDTGKIVVDFLDESGKNKVNENTYGYKYTKGGVRPNLKVWFVVGNEKVELKNGLNYSLKYTNYNPKNPEYITAPSVIISGKGSFSGKLQQKNYKIVKNQLNDMKVEVYDVAASNRGKKFTPAISVIDPSTGNALQLNRDYVIKRENYTYPDGATVVSKVANDNGLRDKNSTIQDTDIILPGTSLAVKIEGINNYGGEINPTYRVVANNIGAAKCVIKTQYYTGKEVELDPADVSLTYNGIPLGKTDFFINEATYVNNINRGTASVEIQGKGIYGGRKRIKFAIVAKPMNTTIVYNKNASDATNAMGDTIATKDIRLAKNNFSRPGYTFAGWMTSPDSNVVEYVNKQLFTIDNVNKGYRVVLYAKWNPVDYTVRYNLNGGANPNNITQDTYNILGAKPLPKPTRNGYTFVGWYSNSSLTNRVKTMKGLYGNKKLYAKWYLNDYKLEYELNGGEFVDDEMKKYNTESQLALPVPKRNGYEFKGWYLENDYQNKVTNMNGQHGDKTLYAKWELCVYKIKYNGNGGQVPSVKYLSYRTIDDYHLNTIVPTRDGYEFVNWYRDDSNCANDKNIVTTVKGLYGDIVVYAKWRAKSK